jgi:hypothetical protein
MTKIVYPAGPVTPHGRYHIRKGDFPDVSLMSPNDQIVIWLMGGHAIPDPFLYPEVIHVTKMSGLIAPWETIDQQGATEDGVSFVDALYGPTEVDVEVKLVARDAKHLRRLRRHLFECLDVKSQSEFGFMTHELGYWWAPIRWWKKPDNPESGPQQCTQTLTLRLRGDSGFWQSFPDLASFGFLYEDMKDEFEIDYSGDLGPNWPQYYTGTGTGYHHTSAGLAAWVDDPDSIFFTGTKRVIAGPYKDFDTPTDDQSVTIEFANSPEFGTGDGAANDVWVRMGRDADGNWDGNGVRGRIGWGYIQLTRFVDFVETTMAQTFELLPPIIGEKLTLTVTGRNFALIRYDIFGAPWLKISYNETEAVSRMGADYRGVGFGMQAGSALITQATPASIRQVYTAAGVLDAFSTVYPTDLGPNWPLRYSGLNDAYIQSNGADAVWVDNSGTGSQEVVNGPYKDFETATDNQVVSMLLGSFPEWSVPEQGANDLWARMGRNPDGSWDGNGVRARIQTGAASLTCFVDFTPVWDRTVNGLIFPGIGTVATLVAGYTGSLRLFKIQIGGAAVLQYQEPTATSLVGPDYRGIGFGVRAAGALITQATPATVRRVTAGDNAEVTQSGFLKRHNGGDQDAYDEYTLYGPATKFLIANGPGSTDMIEFGPLAVGEIAHIRTDPRRKQVFDMSGGTETPVSPALFGASPTDNMARRMKGRFTTDCAIPAKEAGMRVPEYLVACAIQGGNADSRIDAALTPLRRYPQ